MALIETLMLEVGPAIANSILKLWLKDAAIAGDVSYSLIDVLKSKTSDVIAQQRAKRQFEAIGENVAQSLIPVFDSEGRTLDEKSRTVVAQAVADTLDRAKIDVTLLAKNNLDPDELAHYLLSEYPLSKHLTVIETELYNRVINESSRMVVDIATQLPSFSERTFSQVLKHEDRLLSTANQTLEEVRRIREGFQSSESESIRFENDYRQGVARNLDRLELFGLDVSSSSRRHRLSIAYVALDVGQEELATNTNSQSAPDVSLQHEMTYGPEKNTITLDSQKSSISVHSILSKTRRLFIRGVAGSGKTTLLQWVAVRSASGDFKGELAEWNGTIPFFIRVRQCVGQMPAPEDFVRFLVPTIAGSMPIGWVHKQMQLGRALILVDGIDEVPVERKREIYQWLGELVLAYPGSRYLVTARPHSIVSDFHMLPGFDHAELQSMNLEAIDEFIDNWHSAVREETHDTEDRGSLEILSSNLKTRIRQNRPIRNLAANPLLCAMLCALNRDRSQQLPVDRIDLYQAALSMLLERRDLERRLDLKDYPNLTFRQKLVLLQDLAYWMLLNGLSQIDRTRAEERLERRLYNLAGVSNDISGKSIYRLFTERSGIVGETAPDQISFVHHTFQDFLAAQAALDEDDIGVLVRNASDYQWRDVVILASGLASSRKRDELIRWLVRRGDEDEKNRYYLHPLAVACLENAVDLAPGVQAELQRRMEELIPPKNISEARNLASAGTLVIPLLKAQPQFTDNAAVACIRTLVQIEDDSALDILASYSSDKRTPVVTELIRAWEFFDRKEYAKKVLSPWTKLDWEQCPSLNGVEFLTNLSDLIIRDCSLIDDLHPLAELASLGKLFLRNCTNIEDLRPLSNLARLTELSLWDGKQVDDLGPLSNLIHLVRLELHGCTQIHSLEPLARMTGLRWLDLNGCVEIDDLSPLSAFVNLDRLDLTDCKRVSNIAHLASLLNLTELKFGKGFFGLPLVSTLNPLTKLANLVWLDLSGCTTVANLDVLATLVNLRALFLVDLVNITDLKPLSGLTALSELSLQGCNQIFDLNPLANLTQLTYLDLRECTQVTDLSPLVGLTNLSNLDLRGCEKISDLTPILSLPKLKEVRLEGIPKDIRPQWESKSKNN